MIPVFYFIAIIAMEASPGPSSAFVTSSSLAVTVLNPLTTIYFVRPYREEAMRLLCFPERAAVALAGSVAGRLREASTNETV